MKSVFVRVNVLTLLGGKNTMTIGLALFPFQTHVPFLSLSGHYDGINSTSLYNLYKFYRSANIREYLAPSQTFITFTRRATPSKRQSSSSLHCPYTVQSDSIVHERIV